MAINLTNLPNLKNWIGSPAGSGMSDGDNQVLNRLISSNSSQIMRYIGRQTLFKNVVTNDTYTGNGGQTLLVQQWPVIIMNSVMINNVLIPQAPNSAQAGWLLMPWDGFSAGRPQLLQLNGYSFAVPVNYGFPFMDGGTPYNSGFTRNQAMNNAPQNVVLNYTTGYFIQNEPHAVPSGGQLTITTIQPLGTWGQDDGVFYANTNAPLQAVTTNPQQGQYNVANGVYTFSVADENAQLLISYSYIPPDIEQACIEMAGEAYSYKARIGQKSKSLGGSETAAYNLAGMTDRIKSMLNPYKSTIFKR